MSTRRHLTITVLAVAVGLLSAPSSASAYYSLLGGETLKVRDSALSVQVGYPEVRFGYHIPILKNLEIAPKLNLFYAGFGNETTPSINPSNFGLRVGADVRLNLLTMGDFSLALMWKVGLHFNFVSEFQAGMQIGVPGGVTVGYKVTDKVTLVGGLHIPFFVTFGDATPQDPTQFVVPIVFEAGTEIGLTDALNLSVMLEAGPSIVVTDVGPTSITGVDAYVAGLLGIQYLL